mmetsp:Transcript_9302/g.20186  ORF Transcript_9302/g.20186 Transcript_9302/m.20186 type:complete len:208 (+) Transcript_9302:3-626(+)
MQETPLCLCQRPAAPRLFFVVPSLEADLRSAAPYGRISQHASRFSLKCREDIPLTLAISNFRRVAEYPSYSIRHATIPRRGELIWSIRQRRCIQCQCAGGGTHPAGTPPRDGRDRQPHRIVGRKVHHGTHGIEGGTRTGAGRDHGQQEQHTGGHVGDQPGRGAARIAGVDQPGIGRGRLRRRGGVPAQGVRAGGEGPTRGEGKIGGR